MGIGPEGMREDWKGAIARTSDSCTVVFTYGSRDEGGRFAGGRYDSRGG